MSYTVISRRKVPSPPNSSAIMVEDDDDGDEDNDHHNHPVVAPQSPLKNWGARHTLTLLGFLGFASSYSMRVNLSIAIVKMVNSTHHHNHNHNNSSTIACPGLVPRHSDQELLDHHETTTDHHYPTFNWSSQDQGILLGSFFYGYVATQVPGGLLANKVGGKWVFGVGMLVTAVFSLVTPMAANLGLNYLIAVRVIQGLGEGVTNPSMHALLAQWVPSQERSMLGAFVYAGTQIGTVIALPASGWLLGNSSDNMFTSGWPSVFYVFGVLGIVWFVAWSWFVYDTPSAHPRISAEEVLLIQGGRNKSGGGAVRVPTPWRKLLTSPPVLAILVAQTGHAYGLYTMLTELPSFMDDVLHFDIKQNAYLSGLPYFLMWIVSVLSSVYADKMRARGISTGTVRKLFNTIAHWIPALLLVLASHSACNRALTVTLITMAISINGAAWASFQVNHIDLSPNNAAVMMGITNGFANLCGIGAPYVAGVIINDGSSVARWRVIFYIAAVVYFIDNCVYLLFASGETQSWDSPHHHHHQSCGGDRVVTGRAVFIDAASTTNSNCNDPDDDDRSPLLEP